MRIVHMQGCNRLHAVNSPCILYSFVMIILGLEGVLLHVCSSRMYISVL